MRENRAGFREILREEEKALQEQYDVQCYPIESLRYSIKEILYLWLSMGVCGVYDWAHKK
jgi:hypothetical protein